MIKTVLFVSFDETPKIHWVAVHAISCNSKEYMFNNEVDNGNTFFPNGTSRISSIELSNIFVGDLYKLRSLDARFVGPGLPVLFAVPRLH